MAMLTVGHWTHWTLALVIFMAGALIYAPTGSAYGHQWEKALNSVLSHDPRVPPGFDSDQATPIHIQLYIVSFDSISETTMDYAMTVFLRQTWTDSRMQYDEIPGLEKLELDSRAMDAVWIPDTYFNNEKQASFHEVTVPNKLMHIYPNGTIFYSVRVSMLLSCDMYLQKFPFDSQICNVGLESYGHSTVSLVFYWKTPSLILREGLKLPQFNFDDSKTLDCTQHFEGVGNYTCLRADFHLRRNFGYYIAQVYVPSILIVILSWLSFWLDIDAVPARISLGLLTVLTMTTQSSTALQHLPRVSYVKAIDVWMAMCLFFVFAALIEFAYVNVNARVQKRRTNEMKQSHGGLKLDMSTTAVSNASNNGSNILANTSSNTNRPGFGPTPSQQGDEEGLRCKRLFSKATIGRAKARTLDKMARIIFPSIFIAFNIFYWIFYLLWTPDADEWVPGSK